MKKSFKFFLSLTLIAVLCLSLCAGAFAESDCPDVPTAAGDRVFITKVLEIARYTTVPNVTFTFSFAPDANDSVGLQDGESCPAIAAVSASFSPSFGSDISAGKVAQTVKVEFPEYPHAGVYAYKVTESDSFTPAEGEALVNDEAYYIVRVYVINGDSGTEIQYVTVEKFENASDNCGEKVPVSEDGAANGFKFVNVYTKCADGEDGVSLTVSKAVAGKYADTTKKFSYCLTVTAASTADADEAFTYSVAGGEEQDGACGTPISFELKDGESIEIKGLTAGASYDITESGERSYTASAKVVVNGGTSASESAKKGAELALSGKGIGEKPNIADFTNTYDDGGITPTGIIINNLPYVMLAAVAAAGLFVFALSAKRREQEN